MSRVLRKKKKRARERCLLGVIERIRRTLTLHVGRSASCTKELKSI